MGQVLAALQRGERVVTAVAPPTASRSALARAVRERWAAGGAPGALTVLSGRRAAHGIANAVASAIGVFPCDGGGPSDPLLAVAQSLAARGPLLLVLDGFDELTDFALVTVHRWRDLAPATQMLVLSRTPLQNVEEVVVTVEAARDEPAVEAQGGRESLLDRDSAIRLPPDELCALLEEALAQASRSAGLGDPPAAELQDPLGRALRRAGRLDDATAIVEQALTAARAAADRAREGRVLQELGRVQLAQDRLDDAEEALRAALVAHDESSDARSAADTLSSLSLLAARQEKDEALSLAERAAERARAVGDARLAGETLAFLALAHHRFGALPRAGAAYAEAEQAADAAGQTWIAACCRLGSGAVLLEQGKFADARTMLERTESTIAGFDPVAEGLLLAALGAAKAGLGDLVEAGWLLDRAERLLQATDVALLAGVAGPLRGLLDLERADRARSAGDEAAAEEHERRAADRLRAAQTARDPDSDRTRGTSLAAAMKTSATRLLEHLLRVRSPSIDQQT